MIYLHKVRVEDSDEMISNAEYNRCNFSSEAELINFIHKSTGYLFFEEGLKIFLIEKGERHFLEARDDIYDNVTNETFICYVCFSID